MASDHQVRLAERKLRAYVLHHVCALLGFASVVYLGLITVLGPYLPWLYSALGMCAVCVLGVWTTKRGLITSTSLALVLALTIVIVVTIASVGLLYNVVSLFLLVVLASVLLGERGAVASTVVAVSISATTSYLEFVGRIIPHGQDPLLTAVTVSSELIVVGILLFWSGHGHRRMLEGLVTTTTHLDRTERRYSELIHDLADGVVVTDIEGVILTVNPAIERMVGHPASEFVGQHFWSLPFLKPQSVPPIRENFRRILTGEELRRVTVELATDHGRLIVDAAPRLFTRADGHVEISATVRDITEQVRAAEELDQLETQLRASQRLEALGRLAGGVAHDFNNWLTLIIANTELLKDEHGELDELEAIAEAAHRSTALTRQLLLFARRQPSEPQRVDVAEQLDDLTLMLNRLVHRGVELTTDVQTSGVVLIDPTQFEQMVMNLVVNASEAVDRGHVQLRAHDDHGWVVIEVIDDGPGVDEEARAHLFEPFFTTKSEGTGLGLATVHGVVVGANGSIELIPTEHGAHFEVRLPHVEREEDSETKTPALSSPRVLIVDDDDGVRRTVERILETEFDIESTSSGANALEILGSRGFDVVLSDIVMPHMTGTELLDQVREQFPQVRVVLMSGYAQQDELERSAAADAFVAKPFSPKSLRQTVHDVLEQ